MGNLPSANAVLTIGRVANGRCDSTQYTGEERYAKHKQQQTQERSPDERWTALSLRRIVQLEPGKFVGIQPGQQDGKERLELKR